MARNLLIQWIEQFMPNKESDIDKEFAKLLKELPFHVAAKKILGGANDINEPDWFLCVLGRLLLIETKHPDKRTKKAREAGQRIRAKWWQRAGARYVKCTTAVDMIDAVWETYNEQKNLLNKEGEDVY